MLHPALVSQEMTPLWYHCLAFCMSGTGDRAGRGLQNPPEVTGFCLLEFPIVSVAWRHSCLLLFLCRGHANLLCIVPTSVCVLPKWAHKLLLRNIKAFCFFCYRGKTSPYFLRIFIPDSSLPRPLPILRGDVPCTFQPADIYIRDHIRF